LWALRNADQAARTADEATKAAAEADQTAAEAAKAAAEADQTAAKAAKAAASGWWSGRSEAVGVAVARADETRTLWWKESYEPQSRDEPDW